MGVNGRSTALNVDISLTHAVGTATLRSSESKEDLISDNLCSFQSANCKQEGAFMSRAKTYVRARYGRSVSNDSEKDSQKAR